MGAKAAKELSADYVDDFREVRRTGIFVVWNFKRSKLRRSGIFSDWTEYIAPLGLEFILVRDSTAMSRLWR
jgi:hypothetical protein